MIQKIAVNFCNIVVKCHLHSRGVCSIIRKNRLYNYSEVTVMVKCSVASKTCNSAAHVCPDCSSQVLCGLFADTSFEVSFFSFFRFFYFCYYFFGKIVKSSTALDRGLQLKMCPAMAA